MESLNKNIFYSYKNSNQANKIARFCFEKAFNIYNPNLKILFLGSGNGCKDVQPFLNYLIKKDYRIKSIDVVDKFEHSELIQFVKSKGLNFNFYNNDIEEFFELSKNDYDVIVAFSVFRDLVNWKRCFYKIHECLSFDGILIINEFENSTLERWENNRKRKITEGNDCAVHFESYFDSAKINYRTFYQPIFFETDASNLIKYLGPSYEVFQSKDESYGGSFKFEYDVEINNFKNYVLKSRPINWNTKYEANFKNNLFNTKVWLEQFDNLITKLPDKIKLNINLNLICFRKESNRNPFQLLNNEIEVFNINERIRVAYPYQEYEKNGEGKFRPQARVLYQSLLLNQAFSQHLKVGLFFNWDLNIESSRPVIKSESHGRLLSSAFINLKKKEVESIVPCFAEQYWLQHKFNDVAFTEPILNLANYTGKKMFCYIKQEESFNIRLLGTNLIQFSLNTDLTTKSNYFLNKIKKGLNFNFSNYDSFGLFDFQEAFENFIESHSKWIERHADKDLETFKERVFNEEILAALEQEIENDSKLCIILRDFLGKSEDSVVEKFTEQIKKRLPLLSILNSIGDILIIPNSLPLSTEKSIHSGCMVLVFDRKYDIKELIFDLEKENIHFSELGKQLNLIEYSINQYSERKFLPYLFDEQKAAQQKLKETVNSNSISAIMARNLSHNIGSHVIPYIEKLQKRIEKELEEARKLFQDTSRDSSDWEYNYQAFIEKVKEQSEYTKYSTLFNQYTQERDELIADVSSPFGQNLYFDFKANDIVTDFVRNAFIMDGLIDGPEVYEKNKRIDQKVFINNKTCGKEGGQVTLFGNIGSKNPTISIPGGQTGVQAFYVILENIVRNSKKHSIANTYNENGSKTNDIDQITEHRFEFSLSIDEPNDDRFKKEYYKVTFADKLGIKNSRKRKEKVGFTTQGKENLNFTPYEKMNYHLYKEILEEGTLRNEGWGILEMKIAAAYLIGFPLDRIDSLKDFDQTEIKVRENDEEKVYPPFFKITEDEDLNYSFEFYLLKPAFALIDNNFCRTANVELDFGNIESGNRFGFNIFKDAVNEKIDCHRKLAYDQSGFDEIHSSFNAKIWQKWVSQQFQGASNLDILLYEGNEQYSKCAENGSFELIEDEKGNTNMKALFDYHAEAKKDKEESKYTFEVLKNEFYYYEYFDSKSGILSLLKDDLINKEQILEAIYTKIWVFDERIQESLKEDIKSEYISKISNREIQELKRIHIPSGQNFNLNDYNRDNFNLELLQCIKNQLEQEKNDPPTFIVVHFSLLKGGENYEKLKKIIEMNKKTTLILTSGSGRPSDLPKGSYYFHFSSLHRYIIQRPSKYHLSSLLYSTRRTK
ncbi:MAG: hypothetical protein U0V04_03310 [Spirosomataceae bacterium]|jgi:hypothetical protein